MPTRLALLRLAFQLAVLAVPASAQQPADTSRRETDALRVFLDCQQTRCDFDFFRTDITFVDWVRDRKDAQVHLLVTSQRTGGGGDEYTLTFAGQQQFAGSDQVLKYVSGPTSTEDEVRQGLAKIFKLGLARYAASTSIAGRLKLTYDAPTRQDSAKKPVRDPWNYWVFRTRLNGNLNGESRSSRENFNGNLSANRTTERWKVRLSSNGSYGESQYIFRNAFIAANGDTVITADTSRNYSHSYGGNVLVVKSLGEHWSAGSRASVHSSSYANQKLKVQAGPAIEYDLFPYSQSTRRQLTFRYGVNANRLLYDEETIFGLTRENRWDQYLLVSLDTKQKWGSASLSASGSQYFFDLSKKSIDLFGNGEFRIYKGLSVNFFGSYSLVSDQLSLARTQVSPLQTVLGLKEIETSYRYFTFFGLSYTFGSIFNNVVNPRFEESSGGFFFF